ncbi:OLC1v1034157C1 [Oldenlandia corymbosa var. corymbosa]|uniref:OLC1v1034157C1 n=1 Tax=Oldenlandia corymbosa var. corymbosa TaxID=529605 RepID=A0AAV1CQN2_OLDCO|nr:OLC1v1034157C1 [Oldenlandia corymbosa var. corymbosa]
MAATKLSFAPVVKPFQAQNLPFGQSILWLPTTSALVSGTIKEKNIVSIEGRKLPSKWVVLNASSGSTSSISDEEDGVSLGTMKLPANTDLARFETLLFQWGNSLCQGANLPLPLPLKVDKIPGGARLGFIKIEDGQTQVPVYIDCLVFPATESSGPIFRAIRNGPLKAEAPPGEPRIMRSLLGALQKSVELARL